MRITGTRSYIKVHLNGKTVKIKGEMLVGGFIADQDTIKNWEPPDEHIKIGEQEKAEIIKLVGEKTKDSQFVIEFE